MKTVCFKKQLFRALLILCVLPCSANIEAHTFLQEKVDEFRWMETEENATTQWILNQSQTAQRWLNRHTEYTKILRKLWTLQEDSTQIRHLHYAGSTQFYEKITPDILYWRLFVKPATGEERVLIDPPAGNGIEYALPSPNGEYVAYGFSENGSEMTTLRIKRVLDGTDLPETISRIRYPALGWRADSQAFFYARLPTLSRADSASQTLSGRAVYLHQLNHAFSTDSLLFANSILANSTHSLNEEEEVSLYTDSHSTWILASQAPAISGYGLSLYATRWDQLKGEKTVWRKIVDKQQDVREFLFTDQWLYLVASNTESGYRLTRLSLANPKEPAQLVLEWSQGQLTAMFSSRDSLYVAYHSQGQRYFLRLPFDGHQKAEPIPLPFDGEISALFSSDEHSHVLFTLENWVTPPTLLRYEPGMPVASESDLLPSPSRGNSDTVFEEKIVTARDGTRVPLTLIHHRNLSLEGTHPTWLQGYGAYGDSTYAYYDASRKIWLEQGGIIAIAHVRGGGELGPLWHTEGRGLKKINSVYDFIDSAQFLVEQGYTSPQRLVISGRSAGGIVVGMAFALQPQLFAAAAIDVGILNTLRLEQLPIGPTNTLELGSSDTPAGQDNLRSLDAYLNLDDFMRYPAVLLTVGLNDNRVSPWQSAKFAARLQQIANTVKDPNPILLIADSDSGHTAASREQFNARLAAEMSFFLWQTSLGAQKH